MDIKHGHRKPFEIDFVQVTKENMSEVAEWCGGVVGGGEDESDKFIRIVDKSAINTRLTKAFVGDYLVQHRELKTFKIFGKKAFGRAFDTEHDVLVHRDAGTGQFVTEEAVKADPEGTVTESVNVSN